MVQFAAMGLRSDSPTASKENRGSHGKRGIAFEDLHVELRDFAILPEISSELVPIAESAAVECFDHSRGRDRTGHERNANRSRTPRTEDPLAFSNHS